MTWSLQDMATKYTTTRRVGARTDDANEILLGPNFLLKANKKLQEVEMCSC